jgi:DNA polymerase III epsilon subunit-like protein
MRRIVVFDIETAGLRAGTHPIIQFAALAADLPNQPGEDRSIYEVVEEIEVKVQFEGLETDPEALSRNSYNPTAWAREAVPPLTAAERVSTFFRRHAALERVSKTKGTTYRVAEICAYNGVLFDGEFLVTWYRQLGLFCPAACYEIVDPLQLARWISRFGDRRRIGTPPDNLRLESVAAWLGIERPGEMHDALNDARVTLRVMWRLMQLAGLAEERNHG